jgi:hypothetical protein
MRHFAILLASLLVPLSAAQSPTPPSGRALAGTGRIAGRVLTASGAPVEGASVATFYFTQQPRAEHRFDAVSGADGTYVLDGLPAGTFRVIARKPGFSGMTTQPGQIRDGTVVTLDAGGAVSGIDIVLRPTGTIAGRVRRPDGTPVANAIVAAQIRQPDGMLLGVQQGVKTGPDGAYLLENVPQASYVVTAMYSVRYEMLGKAEPGEYQDWARTFHPDTTSFDNAVRIEVRGGDTHASTDVTLQPDPRFSVSGVVVDREGQTPRNAKLQFGTGTMSGGGEVSAASGQFTLRGIGNGPVHLLAQADDDNGRLVGFATVDVQSASITGARVIVDRPARVKGMVIGEGGSALSHPGMRVALAPPFFLPGRRDDADASPVGADGSFHATALVGPRTVSVIGLPPRWELKEVRRAGRTLPDARLTLANGQVVDDLEVIISVRN